MDKAGRRILLIVSGTIMALSLTTLGLYFYIIYEIDPSIEESLSWLPLATLTIFMIGYSVGFATLPFLLMGELLPSKFRNSLGGIGNVQF